jgi:hypothetical protein
MSWNDEADAARGKVDELALSPATADEWRRVDGQLCHALDEARREAARLQRELIAVVQEPGWSWFENRAALLELREAVDDLCVLRMCVQSRIFELEAGLARAAL